MKQSLMTGAGAACGTLLYTGFLSSAATFDWGRAIFVGAFCGLCALLWPRKPRGQ